MSIHSFYGKKGITLLSPAKVNLFFRVLCLREDGYHDIASLYQTITLFDTVIISLAQEDQLLCDDDSIPTDDSNLIFKALHLFRLKTGNKNPIRVELKKKIPVCAGLGGGSSNAATVLWGLNQLFQLNISDEILASWAAEFSSDAPFFFSQGTAYVEGRGDRLTSLDPLPQRLFWIYKPKAGLSTPSVYRNCHPSQFKPRIPEQYLESIKNGDLKSFNDLESSAFDLMPSLQVLKSQLYELGFNRVTMTGSGTAMMCFTEDLLDIKLSSQLCQNSQNLTECDINVYSVQFLNRKPGKWYE